ncbi:hypothetical protein [Streptomyces sp. KL116D]|uniref:hypothetical protein n=1 Tax=Streptomyces sp. KL116D TaxID=3045152 RepID=UPI0035563FE5
MPASQKHERDQARHGADDAEDQRRRPQSVPRDLLLGLLLRRLGSGGYWGAVGPATCLFSEMRDANLSPAFSVSGGWLGQEHHCL